MYRIGDLVQVSGLLGLVVKKDDSILFSREQRWYLVDFLSESEFEPRLVNESDIYCLTIK
tara:strand:- start:683 stop:862 length:180 start_codon:yes stop_codon:yes gene_type:complete